jgi:hypothetical protein
MNAGQGICRTPPRSRVAHKEPADEVCAAPKQLLPDGGGAVQLAPGTSDRVASLGGAQVQAPSLALTVAISRSTMEAISPLDTASAMRARHLSASVDSNATAAAATIMRPVLSQPEAVYSPLLNAQSSALVDTDHADKLARGDRDLLAGPARSPVSPLGRQQHSSPTDVLSPSLAALLRSLDGYEGPSTLCSDGVRQSGSRNSAASAEAVPLRLQAAAGATFDDERSAAGGAGRLSSAGQKLGASEAMGDTSVRRAAGGSRSEEQQAPTIRPLRPRCASLCRVRLAC